MKPNYWTIQLSTRGKVYVYQEDMPDCLRPQGDFPSDKPFIWLKDCSGGPIGFPCSEITSIEWVDDQILLKYDAFALSVNDGDDDDKEPWQQ